LCRTLDEGTSTKVDPLARTAIELLLGQSRTGVELLPMSRGRELVDLEGVGVERDVHRILLGRSASDWPRRPTIDAMTIV
jgi:hypothetical protein